MRGRHLSVKFKVLVLDPDDAFRTELSAALRACGYVVEEGSDGRAVGAANEPTDVLIVEMLMPEEDGLEAIRAARQRWPSVRVLAMTAGRAALTSDYLLGLAAHLGADATFDKAAPIDIIFATLRSWRPGASARGA